MSERAHESGEGTRQRMPDDPATHSQPVAAVATRTPAQADPLSAIYREHFAFVWRSLRRLGAPEHGLEDACQDVFLVAARRLDEFEGRSTVRTWLFGIAMRVVRTHRRKLWRHRRKVDRLADDAPVLHAVHDDPHEQRERQRLLVELLAELDESKRAVYVLIELEGMTAVEVARGFDVNVNTIYTRLRAARRQLRAAAAERLAREEGGR